MHVDLRKAPRPVTTKAMGLFRTGLRKSRRHGGQTRAEYVLILAALALLLASIIRGQVP